MALNLQQKKNIVEELAGIAAHAHSAVAAEFNGISANDMNELRNKARDGGVYLRVVKNSLAKRALENGPFACMRESLSGPLILAFSEQEPGAAARVLRDFGKTNKRLLIRIAAVEGELIAPEQIDRLANLPTKTQAIALLLAVMKAPVEKFVRTLAAPHAKLVRVIAAVKNNKETAD